MMRNYKNKHLCFASRDVGTDIVLESLMKVQNNPAIETVIVQDLLVSNHQILFPLIRSIVAGSTSTSTLGGRDWTFADSLSFQQFSTWQQHRNLMMWTKVTCQANILVPEGTPLKDIMDFFFRLGEDSTIDRVTFTKGAYGYQPPDIPTHVGNLMDADTRRLQEGINVQVQCHADKSDNTWKSLLKECCKALPPRPPLLRSAASSGMFTKNENSNGTFSSLMDAVADSRRPPNMPKAA